MAGNINPIFSKIGKIGVDGSVAHGTALDTTYDGTDADVKLLFTADATNGSYVQKIRLSSRGTNAIAKAKVYINNGSAVSSAANNSLYQQASLPATTGIVTAATSDVDINLNIALPAGYKIYMGIDAATALATGWSATVIAGDY